MNLKYSLVASSAAVLLLLSSARGGISMNGSAEVSVQATQGSTPVSLPECQVLIRFTPGISYYMALSPSGKAIAFTSFEGQVYVVNVNGSNLRQLTDDHLTHLYPAWSPDSNQIAFGTLVPYPPSNGPRRKIDVKSQLEVMDADGSNRHILIDNIATRYEAVIDGSPVWLPDGKRIIFQAGGLHQIGLDGSGLADWPDAYLPAWSPDRKQKAISNTRSLVIVSTDSSYEILLKLNDVGFPFWSRDGKQLVFEAGSGDTFGIYVVNIDGSNLRRLSATGRSPRWSPDDKYIAFRSYTNHYAVHIISPDGTDEHPVTYGNGVTDTTHMWFDATHIAFLAGDTKTIYVVDINNPCRVA
jgi:Tol biopolymer transport system component